MRQKLLYSVLLFAISLVSNAQLTVTGTFSGNDTPTGQFYTLSTGVFTGSPIPGISPYLTKDPSSNLYELRNDIHSSNFWSFQLIIRIANYC